MELALALARKLAGEALDDEPLAVIADAAAQAFQHLRGVPHLAVRVNDDLVEQVDALLAAAWRRSEASKDGSSRSANPTSSRGTSGSNGPTAASSATGRAVERSRRHKPLNSSR